MTTKTKRKTVKKVNDDLADILDRLPPLEESNALTDEVTFRTMLGGRDCSTLKGVGARVDKVESDSHGYSGEICFSDGNTTAFLYFSYYDYEGCDEHVDDALGEVDDLYYAVKRFREAMEEAKAAYVMKKKITDKDG